jgi:hypothetical protein
MDLNDVKKFADPAQYMGFGSNLIKQNKEETLKTNDIIGKK